MDFFREKLEGIQVSFIGAIQSFTKIAGKAEGEAFLSCEMSVDSPRSLEPSVQVRVFWMPDHPSLLRRIIDRLDDSSRVFIEGRLVESQRALSIIARVFEIRELEQSSHSMEANQAVASSSH